MFNHRQNAFDSLDWRQAMGRCRSTALLAGLIAAFSVGCGSRQDSGPPQPPKGKNNLALEAHHPGMARLTIEVRSPE
jgi:hypothetical protein